MRVNILFDTSFLVEIDRKNPKAIELAKLLTSLDYTFWISTITVAEIMVGMNLSKNYQKSHENGTFLLSQFNWFEFNGTAAAKTSQIISDLRLDGKTIEFQDASIAASALILSAEYLITQNKNDFSQVIHLESKVFTIDELLRKLKKK